MRICVIVWSVCFLFFPLSQATVYAKEQPPTVSAKASILMDAKTGRILYAKEADKGMKIASLTKIMTAIVAIDEGNLNQLVTISPNATNVEGSSIYLKAGERVPLKTLLYGLMLRSGNDAAVAIAEHVGGTVEGFTYLMNEKATHLGLKQSHFTNPHGLDHDQHYSSAKDLAILTSYALKNPVFREIVQTEVKDVPWPGETWKRKFYNKNKLLRMYPYANGVKTGFTKQAGRTLVTSAMKEGRQLICVTLNDPQDWQDHINLFDYGFSHYAKQSILNQEEIVIDPFTQDEKREKLKIVAKTSFAYPLLKQEKQKISIKPMLSYPPQLIQKADLHVGSAHIYLADEWIGSVPLISKWQPSTTLWSSWKQLLVSLLTKEGAG